MKQNNGKETRKTSQAVGLELERPVPPSKADVYEELFQASDNSNGDAQDNQVTEEMLQRLNSLSETLEGLTTEVRNRQEQIVRIHDEISRPKIEEQVLTEMHERNRELSEDFHEREVLNPIFLLLIGISDRCRQQAAKAREVADLQADSRNASALVALKKIQLAREADRIEIESALANYGVEASESLDDVFNPETQKCIERIETSIVARHGKVASRLLPGYQRNGKTIRQEYVAVYVARRTNIMKGV